MKFWFGDPVCSPTHWKGGAGKTSGVCRPQLLHARYAPGGDLPNRKCYLLMRQHCCESTQTLVMVQLGGVPRSCHDCVRKMTDWLCCAEHLPGARDADRFPYKAGLSCAGPGWLFEAEKRRIDGCKVFLQFRRKNQKKLGREFAPGLPIGQRGGPDASKPLRGIGANCIEDGFNRG